MQRIKVPTPVRFGVIVVLLTLLWQVLFGATATAEKFPDLIPPGSTVTVAPGAAFVPNPNEPTKSVDVGEGRTAQQIGITPNPLNMNEGIDRQVAEMNRQIKPDPDGVERVAGFSAGSVAGWKWALQSQPGQPVHIVCQGCPNGPGSIAELMPDSGLIVLNAGKLPENVKADIVNLRGDGYASCLNRLSSLIVCPAGILVNHYGVVEALVPGQSYPTFDGDVTVYQVGNLTYYVGETRNPVAVLLEAGGKLIDRNFTLPAGVEAWTDANLPQGKPGYQAEGLTPRQLLQPGAAGPTGGITSAQSLDQPIVQDPIAQATEALQNGWNDAVASTTKAVEAFINPVAAPAVAPAPAFEPEYAPAPVADPLAQAAQVINDFAATLAPAPVFELPQLQLPVFPGVPAL